MLIHSQLVATKFFVPVAPGSVIPRPRLTTLLQESLKHPLTLISAPAGFGKTTLLSTWVHSLPPREPLVAWVSLDEEDNDPHLFWTYVINALEMQDSERFGFLLKYLQSPQTPLFKDVLTKLINLLVQSDQHFLLILDDYHLIIEQEIHTTLAYLINHTPLQMHIILSARTNPPLLLPQLRARRQILEIHTEQLRCTTEETRTFLKEMIGTEFADETIQEVRGRTEGWLAGLHLLALSLQKQTERLVPIDPLTLLEETSGDQHYILDFLIQEVLQRQSPEIQTFLLSTCILEKLTASLCDAVVERTNSQQILERLERSNLFVTSLDSKRKWYRYHALFAEALQSRLEQTQGDLVLVLHHRASLWYAKHDQTTEAILHAFHAHQWHLAADLIERHPLLSFAWGASPQELAPLRRWLEQLPTNILHSRPRLCLASTQLLWTVAPSTTQDAWLDAAETKLRASLSKYENENDTLLLEDLQKQEKLLQGREDLLGEVIASRAFLRSFQGDGQAAVSHCIQELASLAIENSAVHILTTHAQSQAFYVSSANDALAAIQIGQQAYSLAQATENRTFEIIAMASTTRFMIGVGQLREAHKLTQQAIQLGTQLGELITVPEVGWAMLWQADILREWNQLGKALDLAEEAHALCKEIRSINSLVYILAGYAVLLRIHLSRGDFRAARLAIQEFERMGLEMNQSYYSYARSYTTTVDQVRLWLACGELGRAKDWAEELDIGKRYGTPFACEREEVAYAYILLATAQPALALKRLEPVLVRATAGQRWDHVIEARILQALAYQMCNYREQALSALSVAVRLAEPEGYIRRFADEGAPMATLLSGLQEQQRQQGPTPYLDTLLAAFAKHGKGRKRQQK